MLGYWNRGKACVKMAYFGYMHGWNCVLVRDMRQCSPIFPGDIHFVKLWMESPVQFAGPQECFYLFAHVRFYFLTCISNVSRYFTELLLVVFFSACTISAPAFYLGSIRKLQMFIGQCPPNRAMKIFHWIADPKIKLWWLSRHMYVHQLSIFSRGLHWCCFANQILSLRVR